MPPAKRRICRSAMGRAILPASQLRCANYRSTAESEKTHFIYGYSLGAKAISAALKTPSEESLAVWPDSDYRGFRAKVDAAATTHAIPIVASATCFRS